MRIVRKQIILTALGCYLIISGCSVKRELDDGLKVFVVEGENSDYDLNFRFPQSFVSVREAEFESQIDTTDIPLQWIFYIQYENPDSFCFYDSLDTRSSIFIHAGPRRDLSYKTRRLTYFTVPTISPDRIFPTETDSLKVIFDSGDKKFGEKNYRKIKYKSIELFDSVNTFYTYYYISTQWQSVSVVANSMVDWNIDKFVLSYEVVPKKSFK